LNVPAARILLVEDEVSLIQLLEKYLRRLGYEVEAYPVSKDALRSFEDAPQNYDLVIADLGMPDIPGDTLLTRMLEIRPDLRILICSGSPFYLANLPDALKKQVSFLQKPFVPKMLSEALDRLLSRDKPEGQ
jgi:DNA-binding NtrC family response regulator